MAARVNLCTTFLYAAGWVVSAPRGGRPSCDRHFGSIFAIATTATTAATTATAPCEHCGCCHYGHLDGFPPLPPPKSLSVSLELNSVRTDSARLDPVSAVYSPSFESDLLGSGPSDPDLRALGQGPHMNWFPKWCSGHGSIRVWSMCHPPWMGTCEERIAFWRA